MRSVSGLEGYRCPACSLIGSASTSPIMSFVFCLLAWTCGPGPAHWQEMSGWSLGVIWTRQVGVGNWWRSVGTTWIVGDDCSPMLRSRACVSSVCVCLSLCVCVCVCVFDWLSGFRIKRKLWCNEFANVRVAWGDLEFPKKVDELKLHETIQSKKE